METNLKGQTIAGVYLVEDEIASGGMGVVYRAKDLRLQRKVAVKVMHAHVAQDTRILQRFDREAKATASLNHPNIVQVFDVGVHAGIPYFVMEFINHPTLAQVIKKYGYGRGIPLDLFFKISRSLCRGLAHAHDNGMVHRDLKPANIFVAEDGRAIIADFGLVHVDSATKLTKTGTYVGTPVYLSPEAAVGEKATSLSDIYQVGIIMHEMLAGMRPFPGRYVRGLSGDSFPESYRRVCQKRQDVAPWIDEVIERCLEINPRDRYRTAQKLERALEPKTVVNRQQQKKNSSQKPLALALITLFLFLAGILYMRSSTINISKLDIKQGVGGLRLEVTASEPCKAMAICRSENMQPLVAENNTKQLKHRLSFKGLAPGKKYELQAIVTSDHGTTKSDTITAAPLSAPRFPISISVFKGAVEAKFNLANKWNVQAELKGTSKGPAAVERNGESVVCRGKIESHGRMYSLDLTFQREGWEEFRLPNLTFFSPGQADSTKQIGISLWNILCRADLLSASLPVKTVKRVSAEGVSRLCIPWRPTASIDALALSSQRAKQAGLAVDIVLFINKTPTNQKRFNKVLRQLIVKCGKHVDRYHLSAFIDGMGWYSSTSDYFKLLSQVRQILSEEDLPAKVQAGSFGMLKDPTFGGNLLKTTPNALRAGASVAFSPCLSSDEWGISYRLACYNAIIKTAGQKVPPWTVFLGTPSEDPPFYDTPLSSLVLGEKSLRNLGNPDLVFLSPAEGKALAEKDRATMINFFASANLSTAAKADEMVKETIRAIRGGVSTTHWVIEPDETTAFFKGGTSKFAHIIANLAAAFPNCKPVSDSTSGTRLSGFGITLSNEKQVEWYAFEGPTERRIALWPQKRGKEVEISIAGASDFITILDLEALRCHYRFLPLQSGRLPWKLDGPIVAILRN